MTKADPVLIGGSRDDVIPGYGGVDHLDGGAGGNDLITGGAGNDVFAFMSDFGADRATDYQDIRDKFMLEDGLRFQSLVNTQVDLNQGGVLMMLGYKYPVIPSTSGMLRSRP